MFKRCGLWEDESVNDGESSKSCICNSLSLSSHNFRVLIKVEIIFRKASVKHVIAVIGVCVEVSRLMADVRNNHAGTNGRPRQL